MTTGDTVYSLKFSLIKILPEPRFDLGSTAGESCVLTARLHMLYTCIRLTIILLQQHDHTLIIMFASENSHDKLITCTIISFYEANLSDHLAIN